ncbi:hypothetical protein MKX03_001327 [Papaver bracteatum]|nr:hypothetical protein MKX03_001327 [Papaver bracteatum]
MSSSISDSVTEANSSSSDTDIDLERFRRFKPGGTLKRIPNVVSLSVKEIRAKSNIPKTVKITKVKEMTDPVGKDEVVASLYQLYCGLLMPIDSFTCMLLNEWGITVPQMHPSLSLVLQRVLSISNNYCRMIFPKDVQKFIVPVGRQVKGCPWRIFLCEWKNRNSRFRFDGFPKNYREWDKHFYKFQNWRKDHMVDVPAIPTDKILGGDRVTGGDNGESDYRIKRFFSLPDSLFGVSLSNEYVEWRYNIDWNANEVSPPTNVVPLNRRPGITVIDSHSDSDECSFPKVENMNPVNAHWSQESSSSPSIMRIPRNIYKPQENRCKTSDIMRKGEVKFKRLRKGIHPEIATRSRCCPKRSHAIRSPNLANTPDVVPRKVRMESRRRSSRVNTNVKYTYDDSSSADSPSDFVISLRKNIESESPNSSAMGAYSENPLEDDPATVVPTVDLLYSLLQG